MEISFSFEEQEIRRSVRKFVKNDLLPICREIDETGAIPEGVRKKFLAMELLKAPFPPEWGGAGGTFTALVIGLKELSYATPVPAWILFENFMLAYPLLHYGSDALKSACLGPLLSLDKIGGFAFTETETGSDPVQLKTTARRADGKWAINGAKRFITHSGICDYLILFARTQDTVSAFLVESSRPGYMPGKRESFLHVRGFDNGDLYLEEYMAPEEHLIGQVGQGFEILLKTESVGKIAFCALFVGMAERACDLALAYAATRCHRGKPIGAKFQMTQVKLAGMLTRTEAMKAYLFHVCALVDQGKDVAREAAGLKLFVANEIKAITADAMEVHGAYGLSTEYDIARLYQTAIMAQAVMGSLDIQRVIVAKSALAKAAPGL